MVGTGRVEIGVGEAGPGHRDTARAAQISQAIHAGLRIGAREIRNELHEASALLFDHVEQRLKFAIVGKARRNRTALEVFIEERGGQAPGAIVHGLVEQRDHLPDLVVGRDTGPRVVAHHVQAQRRVPHQRHEIQRDAVCVDRVAISVVVAPCERHVRIEGVQRHVLDVGKHGRDRSRRLGLDREQRQRAVPDERGGDPMLQVRVTRVVPPHVRIEVGVRVDEARRDEGTASVEDVVPVGLEVGPDLDDHPFAHPHIGSIGRGTRTVDDGAAGDQQLRRLHEARA
ncbi:unannotated protein [freshwater metagenome]|uniref:Unannotated protein n=1 Tax=freshwater metagenome TaxID=449393 RepID=A0A6J7JLB0_9ZZZZ